MAEHTQERTERATPRKRQEARRKGQVGKSTDLASSVPILLLALMLPMAGGLLVTGLFNGMCEGLDASRFSSQPGEIGSHFLKAVTPVLPGLAAIAGITLLAGLAANFGQVGFHPTLQAIQPKFERVNPLSGIKRLLSRRGLFETVKSIAKLGLVSYIAWNDVVSNWDAILNLSALSAVGGLVWVGQFIGGILLKVAFAWLVIGAIDFWFQRKQFEKDIMMSVDEVKREMRETETSPELRAEMHRRRQRLSRARMMANVKHADAVITNPIEYAVALKYDPKKSAAPIVLAKGRHLVADRIREEAKKHKVPLIPNPPLARSLFEQVEVGDPIPSNLFQAVAEVLAFVFKKRGRKL